MSQKIDGKKIAQEIQIELKNKFQDFSYVPKVALITVAPDAVIEKYMSMKMKFAESIGVSLVIHRFPETISTDALCNEIQLLGQSQDKNGNTYYQGFVVQLPLPQSINTQEVIQSVPSDRDIDVLHTESYKNFCKGSLVMPPVVGAIHEMIKRYSIDIFEKKIVVIGKGSLVGRPIIDYLKIFHIHPIWIDKDTSYVEKQNALKQAHIIITGAGDPYCITTDDVSAGVVIFDAGTSESAGKVVGDVYPEVYEKASYYTPVPGGIGPVTIAILMRNLYFLCTKK